MPAALLRYLPQIIMILGAAAVLGTALARWHWELAREGPLAELADLRVSIATAATLSARRQQELNDKAEAKNRENRTAVAAMLAATEADADRRLRDRDARIDRLRRELAAARDFHRRNPVPGARASPTPGPAAGDDPGADRGRHQVADPVLDTAEAITERFVALSRGYLDLLQQAEAGRCIVIED